MGKGIPRFTEAHASLLARFLASPRRPEGTMTYPRAAGFLFGIAHGPELIPPSEWTPIIFNGQDANFETREEAVEVLEALLALYNDCNRQGTEGSAGLPQGCEIRERALDNLVADAPLSQWAQGFVSGHTYLEELWNECTIACSRREKTSQASPTAISLQSPLRMCDSEGSAVHGISGKSSLRSP